MGKTQ
jgi:hypothetical protein